MLPGAAVPGDNIVAGTTNSYKRRGCKIQLSCNKRYRFKRPLNLCRAMVIEGCGGAPGGASTILEFPRKKTEEAGCDGVVVHGAEYVIKRNSSGEIEKQYWEYKCPRGEGCPGENCVHWGAQGTVLRDLAIQAYDDESMAIHPTWTGHGVKLRARAHLDNVWIRRFPGNCIDGGGAEVKNGWSITRSTFDLCGGDGIYLGGGMPKSEESSSLTSTTMMDGASMMRLPMEMPGYRPTPWRTRGEALGPGMIWRLVFGSILP